MKKLLCLILIALMAASPALAEGAPRLSSGLIPAAKQAAVCLASGDYDRLATLLPYSGPAPSAGDWAQFARGFDATGGAQSEYAVAYWIGDSWHVAVPMAAPDSGDVETLVLLSGDGNSFSGCQRAVWSQVEKAYHASDHVVWDREYVGGAPQVFAD